MTTRAPAAAAPASSFLRERRRIVQARLARLGPPRHPRRTPPPAGQLGTDDYPMPGVRDALVDLGPLFAGFGRYLASRVDLVAQRDAAELARIPDVGRPMTRGEIDAAVWRQLGNPLAALFPDFDYTARRVALWVEHHDARIAPDTPVTVALVRPDAAEHLADAPLLMLLHPWFEVSTPDFAGAADDYVRTVERRMDLRSLAADLAAVGAEGSAGGGFSAPACHRRHSGDRLLTTDRLPRTTVEDLLADRGPWASADAMYALASRIAAAWLGQAMTGRLVPYGFGASDIALEGTRLVLMGGVFEPHSPAERREFFAYASAVANDDADTATAWIMSGAASPASELDEDELLRRFRQAVPFRDGEWSGEDRLAEHVLVQWRIAREAGWRLTPHHVHLYRGMHALSTVTAALAPTEDPVLAGLSSERLRAARDRALRMMDPFSLAAAAGRQLQDFAAMPRAFDTLLTMASESRLRIKLNVPPTRGASEAGNRTVALVALLIAVAGLAMLGRQLAPLAGPDIERIAALAILVLGGWLLVAAARA